MSSEPGEQPWGRLEDDGQDRLNYDAATLEELVVQGAGVDRHLRGPASRRWRFSCFTVHDRVAIGCGVAARLVFDRAPSCAPPASIEMWSDAQREAARRLGVVLTMDSGRPVLVARGAWNTLTWRCALACLIAALCGLPATTGGQLRRPRGP